MRNTARPWVRTRVPSSTRSGAASQHPATRGPSRVGGLAPGKNLPGVPRRARLQRGRPRQHHDRDSDSPEPGPTAGSSPHATPRPARWAPRQNGSAPLLGPEASTAPPPPTQARSGPAPPPTARSPPDRAERPSEGAGPQPSTRARAFSLTATCSAT